MLERPAGLGPGMVRAVAGSGESRMLLVAPVYAGQTWAVVDARGNRLALPAVPLNATVALGDNAVAWGEAAPLGVRIHRQRLSDMQISVTNTDAPAILDLSVVGDSVLALFRDAFGWKLGRVRSDRFERLASLDGGDTFLAFGECSEERVVVVDAHEARFLVLRAPDFRGGSFVSLRSEIVEAAKRNRASIQTFHGAKAHEAFVVAHRATAEGHGFVIARVEKGVGRYFVEFDEQGQELRRSLLRFPGGDSKKAGVFYFKLFRGDESTLEATQFSGEAVVYRAGDGR